MKRYTPLKSLLTALLIGGFIALPLTSSAHAEDAFPIIKKMAVSSNK